MHSSKSGVLAGDFAPVRRPGAALAGLPGPFRPLGSIALGSIALGSIALGSIALGSIALGSIALGSAALGGVACSISKPYLSTGTFGAGIASGSVGNHVQALQADLKVWGYYDGPLDGTFGSQLAEAVRYYQQWRGLEVDGIVGPETQGDLCAFLQLNGDPNAEPGDGNGSGGNGGGTPQDGGPQNGSGGGSTPSRPGGSSPPQNPPGPQPGSPSRNAPPAQQATGVPNWLAYGGAAAAGITIAALLSRNS